jgi:small redox-active disulfide protein 2
MKKLEVYGPGCARCEKLAEHARAAAEELGIEYTLEKITDIEKISAAGVFLTPALAVDGKLKLVGKVPSPQELKPLLR